VIFNNYGWGFHAYAEGGSLQGFTLLDNIAFNNGVVTAPECCGVRPAFLVGGTPAQAKRVVMRRNSAFVNANAPGSATGERLMELGWGSQNQDVVFEENWWAGGDPGLKIRNWTTAIIRNNRGYSRNGLALTVIGGRSGWTWSGNQWWGRNPSDEAWLLNTSFLTWTGWRSQSGLGASDMATVGAPSSNWVRVAPTVPGYGVVVVFNHSGASSVSVDLTSIASGTLVVRRAEQPFGSPVATGSGTLNLPLQTTAAPVFPLPQGASAPSTGTAFAAFVVGPR
jgi:hypothetical protein